MSIRDIPTFPYQLVEPDDIGFSTITKAPLVEAERVFFMLFTSEEFQNCPQNFGSVSLESRSLLMCFHAMASIAISHADNVYTRIESFTDRPASNVIFRTFEHPTQRGNFAILMQVRPCLCLRSTTTLLDRSQLVRTLILSTSTETRVFTFAPSHSETTLTHATMALVASMETTYWGVATAGVDAAEAEDEAVEDVEGAVAKHPLLRISCTRWTLYLKTGAW